MRHFGMRRVKALFLTIFSFSCCFVLLLNLMVHQLNKTDREFSEHAGATNPSAYKMRVRQLSQQQENSYVNVAGLQWVDRKPQAANERILGDINNVLNNKQVIQKGTNNNEIITGNGKMTKDRPVVYRKVDKFLFPNRRKGSEDDYTYEEDIEKVVIEDEPEMEEEQEEYDDDDVDPDEDYDEDEADGNPMNIFEKLKNSSKDVFTKPPLHFQEVVQTTPTYKVRIKDINVFPYTAVVERIFWSPQVEQLIPKGMSNDSLTEWIRRMRATRVKSLQSPSWNRCGRPKNGYVVMEDGTEMCARYRHPHDAFVLGEVLSFYLSVLLGMDNVPAVLLSRVNHSSIHWQGHTQDTTKLGWAEQQFVALIQWIGDMNSMGAYVKMPKTVLEAYSTGTVINSDTIAEKKLSAAALSEIVQWGSMVIFDYLTGNYDRVASMQDAAEKEKLPKIIQENIRNLRKSTATGRLWLIDNESGLLDAYDLLYNSGSNGDRFIRFHQGMLQTMCIFQKPLVNALNRLDGSINPHEVLEHYARLHEPLIDDVHKDGTYNLFKTNFSKRLRDVIHWIQFCQESHKR